MSSNAEKIIVWGRRNSMNVQKVMWALGELNLDYQRNDMAGSFGVDDQYTAKNPNAVVPTIEDGELTLYESNACVRYLARQYGIGSLCPSDVKTAAIADQWMDWQCSTFVNGFFMIFLNKIRVPAAKSDPSQITKGEQQTAHLMNQLETRLEQNDYLAGETLTMADIPIGARATVGALVVVDLAAVFLNRALFFLAIEPPAHRSFGRPGLSPGFLHMLGLLK